MIQQCSRLAEDRGSLVWLAEVDEAAAVALEGVGVFGDDAELLPARGGVGIPVPGGLRVSSSFGERGGGGDEGVVGVGGAGLVAGGEALGDVEVIDRKWQF